MKIEKKIYLITFTDITELLLKENMLISQSKKALMGEMIDAVAHQWRQPISVLHMNMSVLQMKMDMDEISNEILQDIIDVANKQTEHMTETLDEFRGFFRPHNRKKVISIKTLIESVLLLIKDDLIKNTISVNIVCDDLIKIECIPNELKHILINIINNAKDAFLEESAKHKNRKIDIDVSQNDTESIILIKDNAGGIPDTILNNIFNENFSTKTDKGGTGIGLYMSKMIIEKIDGNISVYNFKNGACFSINIPSKIK